MRAHDRQGGRSCRRDGGEGARSRRRTHRPGLRADRTDRRARAVEGLDGALERAAAYHEAGADVLFIEAPESESEVAAVADAFPDVPLLFNWVERGRSPMLPLERLAALGFALVILPVATLFSATAAMQRYLAEIRLRGTPLALLDHAVDFESFGDLVSLPAIRAFEERIAGVSRNR